MSRERPVVIVCDDLHWADKPTLLLLRHIVRSQHEGAICLVGTYRDTELGRTHPLADLLADLLREHSVSRVPIAGLSETGVRDLIRAWSVPAAAREFASVVTTQTEGNPFFIREILRHLDETGALSHIDSHWQSARAAELGIPEGVKEAIGRRLTRLGETTNRVLLVAAVIGREFSIDVLAPLSEMNEDSLLDALETAAAAGILAEVPGTAGRFAFTHALIRETLYEELSTTRRVRLHRRVGGVLESMGSAAPADLAHHFAEAAPGGDIDKAIQYAIKAAETAAQGLAHEEAARFCEIALHVADLKPSGEALERLRFELHRRRGQIFASVALWSQAKPEFNSALEHLQPENVADRAETLLALATTTFFLLDVPAMSRLAGEALELAERIGRDDLAADAMGWLGRVHQSNGDLEAAMAVDRQALARVPGRFTVALCQTPLSLYWIGRMDEAVSLGRQAAAYARQAGDSTLTMFALPHCAIALAGAGQYSEALRVFAEARAYGERHGVRPLLARTVAMSAGFHQDVLDYETAESLAYEARDIAATANFVPPVVSAGIDLLLIYARRQEPGRAEALVRDVEEAVGRAGGWHGWLWRLRLAETRAELALSRGNTEEAVTHATDAIEQSRARRRLKYEILGLATRADALASSGRVTEALIDLDAATELARRLGDPAVLVRVLVRRLPLDGTDALAAEARDAAYRIVKELPQGVTRQRFTDAESIHRLLGSA